MQLISNYLTKLLSTLLPNQTSESVVEITSFIINIAVMIILFLMTKRLVEHFFDKNPVHRITFRGSQSPQRLATINTLLRNLSVYVLYFFFIYALLEMLGFPVASLIAGAGIAGVAVGLGAQDMINDMINGFFILFENHFEVGDSIHIPNENIMGTIMELGIRTTTLKAANGDIFYIPNSQISIINNKSRSQRQILIEIPIDYQTNLKQMEDLIGNVTEKIHHNYSDVLLEEPDIIGLVRGIGQSFNYRIAFIVPIGKDYRYTSIFYREYLLKLQSANIHIPNSMYDHSNEL